MINPVQEFKKRMYKEGRSFKWFHKKYIKNLSYVYFMIQLHDEERMHNSVVKAIKKFMEEK